MPRGNESGYDTGICLRGFGMVPAGIDPPLRLRGGGVVCRAGSKDASLAVLTLLSACILFGGEKIRSGGGALGDRALPKYGPLGERALPSVTAEEIAQGWRLVAETNCDADIYAMPDGITPSFNWHRRGTFGEWARLDLGDFAFPLGTNDGAGTSFSVFNDGRIRPTPRDAAREICAVGVPMLAMQRLAMLRVRFARWAFRCSPCSGQVGFGWGMRPARRAGPTRERF